MKTVRWPGRIVVTGEGDRFASRCLYLRGAWSVRGFTPADVVAWAASPASRHAAVAVVVDAPGPCLVARALRIAAPWLDVVIDTVEPLGEADRLWCRRMGVLHLLSGPVVPPELDAVLWATVRRHADAR